MTARDLLLLAEARELAASGRAAEIRERAGLSQGEVAAAVGVSQACLSRWESGARSPRGKAACRFARLLRTLAAGLPARVAEMQETAADTGMTHISEPIGEALERLREQ